MDTVVLVVHLFLAFALIGVILLQPTSDGGGLTSSSSTMSGFMSPRGSANLLTRATGILAFLFMITSLTLVVLSGSHKQVSILDQMDEATPAVSTTDTSSAPASTAAPDVPEKAQEKAPAVPTGK